MMIDAVVGECEIIYSNRSIIIGHGRFILPRLRLEDDVMRDLAGLEGEWRTRAMYERRVEMGGGYRHQ